MKKSSSILPRLLFTSLISIITALLFISFSGKKKNEPALPFLASVDAVVEDQIAKQEIYGCAVGVVQNGNIVHVKAYGHDDRLRKNPI